MVDCVCGKDLLREVGRIVGEDECIIQECERTYKMPEIFQILKRIETDSNAFYMLENELGKRSNENL